MILQLPGLSLGSPLSSEVAALGTVQMSTRYQPADTRDSLLFTAERKAWQRPVLRVEVEFGGPNTISRDSDQPSFGGGSAAAKVCTVAKAMFQGERSPGFLSQPSTGELPLCVAAAR